MTDSGQLLADLKTTTKAVENHDWVSAGLGGATTALDLLGASQDPLAALTSAGFGMITELVRFLEEPLKQLQGNPDSVSSHSQDMEGSGQQVSSVAEDYRQSAGPETSGWSGSSASSYRDNSSQHADCVEAVGQAGIAMAKAATGAGKVVAKAQQEVGGLISEAVGQIIQLMTQAFAAAQATFGASIAAAIPQAVAIATQYGGQIAQKLGVLLSDSDNLLQLITSVTQGLEAATQLMTKLSEASKSGSGDSSSASSSDSRYPSSSSQYPRSSESQYPADSQYSDSDPASPDAQYPGQHRPRTPVSTAQQT
ncbi:hypothetical protein [Amycolatopsis echigonensis]|uniref:ESX-1 secretion-associated protein EspA/EspE-like domain-containing protein n=1 Tax=Amycolatopsis echigonensis TaxID=2576905 RepID=A0A8E1W750_9PSEU|nr:hypothetical protein [Amycolatopsis echigonensis]MBB2505703.1 hypothetical protein [Amycolatopsis echigonensis]